MGGGNAPPATAAGTEGQTYCLRWNNHQTNLVQILHALHEVGSYVDCTLVVDDEQFKAHRVVLAANSPYFQSILQDVPQDHCSIILPGIKGFEIAALLQYMYTGETTVTKSQEPEILRTAKELQVKGLYDNLMKFNHKPSGSAADEVPPSHHAFHERASATSHVATSSSSSSGALAAKPTSSGSASAAPQHSNGNGGEAGYGQHNSSSVISTSTHISPSAAISSSSSPPPPFGAYHHHQPPYTNLNPHISASEAPLTPTHSHAHSHTHTHGHGEAGQWPLSPSAAAAAMLNSVYESAADMNPLKRKKLSAISSMFMNRDTPILRNVLAQANPADSSVPNPLMLPGTKSSAEKTPTHQHSGGNSHSFNGSDYGGDKEPLSPHTDRSFDEDTGNGSGKKPEWKRYKQYTRADMMCAIQCVREGMSALQASRKFGLPSRTLYDKVRKLNINTGRGTHRAPKQRSPPSAESSAAFPYAAAAAAAAHNYGQSEQLLMHDEREPKEHQSHHGRHSDMPPTIPHSAAALLDRAFLQQALENRGGDIAGREALHAMALAAAAHAAANRMSSSSPPGSNGHHYAEQEAREMELAKHERQIKREAMEMDERDADDEDDLEQEHEHDHEHEHEHEHEHDHDMVDDHVEDLSLARKQRAVSPAPLRLAHKRPESPYSPPLEGASVIKQLAANGERYSQLEASSPPPPAQTQSQSQSQETEAEAMPISLPAAALKRELIEEARTD